MAFDAQQLYQYDSKPVVLTLAGDTGNPVTGVAITDGLMFALKGAYLYPGVDIPLLRVDPDSITSIGIMQ